ncbi:MAG: hypothetical protein AAGJ54_06115 [Planctomycetota bacterium]
MTPAELQQRSLSLGFAPAVWLGAEAPGGLALPSAKPAADTLYGPRGVWFDDDYFIVCDSGNHRILVWRGIPDADHAPAEVVLGHASFADEGPALLQLPTCAMVVEGNLIVADSWHHRLLIWDGVPRENNAAPARVIGQSSMDEITENRGRGVTDREGFYWPYAFGFAGGRFFVCDTGNRRVLAWPSLPEPGEPPRWLIGQDDWSGRGENRDGAVGPTSFRWPHAVAGDDESLYIADAGNHRVLGWTDAAAACAGAAPDLVLGQDDFASAKEWPYGPQAANVHRFPYCISFDGDRLAISDTANNRVLLHDPAPRVGVGIHADGVLAQPGFAENGENRWKSVVDDTLCWPYGMHLRGDVLAVADSGNNRVMIWKKGGL